MSASAEIDLSAKVAWLRRRESFSGAPNAVEAIETHFAWVFLSKRFAYKLKKPLRIRLPPARPRPRRAAARCFDRL